MQSACDVFDIVNARFVQVRDTDAGDVASVER